MENINLNCVLDPPGDGCVDSTPDDLSNLNFDEWDKNFIASFEENIFNLMDDDGKNVGFMLSPKGKGNPLFLSPDGKRLSPESFRKTLATPPENLKFTPITGPELQGFPGAQLPNIGSSSFALQNESNNHTQQVVSSTQPKKQLFPCETVTTVGLSNPNILSNECSTVSVEDILNTPLPSKGRLQAARLRFKLTLQKAVQQTAERINELQRLNGESEVMVKHPELRQALGTQGVWAIGSEKKSAGHINDKSQRHLANMKSAATTASARKPYSKENCKRVSTYSRIQPKPTQLQCFTLCPLKSRNHHM